MESGNYLRQAITRLKGQRFTNLRDLAQKAGISQGNLSSFMKPEGEPGRRETMSFDTAWKILEVLGLSLPQVDEDGVVSTIRRTGSNSPVEIVAGDDLPQIPVMGEVGAGNEVDLFEAVPECFISVLPRYYRQDMVTFKVSGDSMAPTISMGDYVGIIPFDGNLHEGGIYLVDLPPFGRVVKRVRMGKNGEIILLSDNPSYGERVIPYEGYEKIVLGQVCWIMQKCWEF